MDVNEELKFFEKIQKKIGGGGPWGGSGGSGLGGQGGCERRIESKKFGRGVVGSGGGGASGWGGGSGWM